MIWKRFWKMIVYELEQHFCLIRQNDHALVSGQLFAKMKQAIVGDNRLESLRKAVIEHDRAWIEMDEIPLWNDTLGAPHSFMDYPLALKLRGYQNGITLTEKEDLYAGLLCSLHYEDVAKKNASPLSCEFVDREQQRQDRIIRALKITNRDLLHEVSKHVNILQFLDYLSLLICFREETFPINVQLPWNFRGFVNSEQFTETKERIEAEWIDIYKLTIKPFIFIEAITVHLMIKYVKKEHINRYGLDKAYQETDWTKRIVEIVS